jgi:predicted nuclease with RNAse H fold
MGRYVGIDVGSRALHAVAIDDSCAVTCAAIFETGELDELVAWAGDGAVAAVDAPDGPSRGAHSADATVAPKFRRGRCGEVALGRRRGYWVPWVTPAHPAPGSWIDVGIRVHAALPMTTIEVFPNAGFRVLAGGASLPKKTSVQGVRARARLLRDAGLRALGLEAWSHDGLDAALAALVALHCATGGAVRVGCAEDEPCGQDGSAIWLPPGVLA